MSEKQSGLEAALREAEERYRSLFETSRDGIVTVAMDGRIREANAAYQEMLGYTLAELRELTYQDLTPARWHAAEAALVESRILAAAGDSGEYEKEYVRKDGTVFPVSLRTWPILDATGRPVALRAFVRDITERKRAEAALQAADRRKDEFLAMLAHELRNPLAPLRTGLQVLAAGTTKADERRVHGMMSRQVEHLVRLVDDLMDVSRITRGKIRLQREPVDLADVLRDALETCRPQLAARGHHVELEAPAGSVVDADPVRLAQVFTNLFDNAAKYTEHGGQIAVRARSAGGDAVVTVTDDGVGIEEAMLPRVFDLFSQAGAALERTRGGLGIGLALARALLELHGGTIDAFSDGPGQGSEFVVRLPLAAARAAADAARTEGEARPAVLPPRRVLVVDDNRDAADSLVMLLETLGSTGRAAYDGEGALAAFDAFRPEVVFIDMSMPGMDGCEVARRVRARGGGDAVRLVALTGHGQEEHRARTRAAGFDEHVVKPLDVARLPSLLAAPSS